MTHTGFRLHPDKDADILADLAKYKDKTARLKEIYRKGLRSEGYEHLGASHLIRNDMSFAPRFEGDKLTSVDLMPPQHIPGVGVVTRIKSPPPVKIDIKVNNKKVEPKEQAKANILQGFGD